jgi:predicted nucleotide-binding protein
MPRDHNDPNRNFIDTIPVSLKKDGIPSTQDILDVISYLEKEKKLDSYQAMVRYLSTTSINSLDDHLKEIGLTSHKAVKEVINGIEGLKRVNTDFSRLSENLAPFTLHSDYLSSLNKLIKPLAGSSFIGKEFEDLFKQMQVGTPVTLQMQEALKGLPITGISKEVLDALKPMQVGMPVTLQMQEALKQTQDLWKSFQPVTSTWKQAIEQLQPIKFETFLPESQEVVSRKLTVAPDLPVSRLVKTLEATENELAETTRTVSNLWKPEPVTVGTREQAFLEDLYARAAQKSGKPDKEATFQIFEPSNSEQRKIAEYLSKKGLAKLKRDCSTSITEMGARFVEKVRSEQPFMEPVFLVHGRDPWMKNAVTRVLEKMNLKPIKLDKVNSEGRTIIEKLLDTTDDIRAVIVLLSPDDRGALKDEIEAAIRPRARQNVIYELGFVTGKFGRKDRRCVIIICKRGKTLEIPSDIAGVELIHYTNNRKWPEELASELRGCGYAV